MGGLLADPLGWTFLNYLAGAHHRDPIGDVADHPDVVGDEEVRQSELVLKVGQVDDLRLD